MKAPWTYGTFSAWQGTAHVIIDVDGSLVYVTTDDDAVNWLYLNGHKDAARALNAHVKANS